jgi:uncharacterized protein YjbI with pentapeptide repeats
MQLLLPDPLVAGVRALGLGVPGRGCLRVMAMWEPAGGDARAGRLLPQDLFWETVQAATAYFDEGLPKVHGELLVSGSARSAAPVTELGVQVALGAVKKTLHVFGERFWSGGRPSKPTPFTEIPITWERALGGPKDANNYAGRGEEPDETVGAVLLPNVELPDRLIGSPNDRPPPAGFGPRLAAGLPRRDWLGTMDERWIEDRCPEMPLDFNPLFGQEACEDQWSKEYWCGDEPFSLLNMHPTLPRWEGRLPGLRARAWVRRVQAPEPAEVPLVLDTVWFFPTDGRVALVWRGLFELIDDDLVNVLDVMAALEWLGEPRPDAHYSAARERRAERPRAGQSAHDSDLLPDELAQRPPAEPSPPPRERYAEAQFYEEVRKTLAVDLAPVRAELGAQREALAAAGASTAELDRAIADLEPDRLVERMKQGGEPEPPVSEQIDAALAETRAELVAAGADDRAIADLDAAAVEARLALARAEQEPGEPVGPPRLSTAREQFDILGMLASIRREIEKDVPGAGARVALPPEIEKQIAALDTAELERDLALQEERAREQYRRGAHRQRPCDRLGARSSSGRRAEVLRALAAGRSLHRWDLTAVDLGGIDFGGADLSEAWLESASLAGANLAGCHLVRAVLARADLSNAKLVRADLRDGNLGGALASGADLTGAALTGAICTGADLTRASFAETRLGDVDLSSARFAENSFRGCRARGMTVRGVDLSRSDFTQADLGECTFIDCRFDGARFDGATLERALFLACQGDGACFDDAKAHNLRFARGEGRSSFARAHFRRAQLDKACLGETVLAAADFRDATALGAIFSGSDLSAARFDGVRLCGARFDRADLTGARFVAADLMDAELMRARAGGADFRHANLFGVGTLRMRLDAGTRFEGANLEGVRFFQPVRQDAPRAG